MTKELERTKTAAVPDKKRTPPALKMRKRDDGVFEIDYTGDIKRLVRATGDEHVTHGLLTQMIALGSQGTQIDENASNFALGFVDSMQPRDAAEALLMTQMAAIHQAMMMFAQRLNQADNIPQQDAAERALNKLARSFTAQTEALKRYRSKGQQTVRVERVTVNEGGQAVVGNVNHGGKGHEEI